MLLIFMLDRLFFLLYECWFFLILSISSMMLIIVILIFLLWLFSLLSVDLSIDAAQEMKRDSELHKRFWYLMPVVFASNRFLWVRMELKRWNEILNLQQICGALMLLETCFSFFSTWEVAKPTILKICEMYCASIITYLLPSF